MNDVERNALSILQKAFAALSGKGEQIAVVHYLHRLERNTPELFIEVVKQMEGDNGRWSSASQMPSVEVCRDADDHIEAVIFSAFDQFEESEAFIWLSDRVDIKWFESFAEELLQTNAAKARALMKRPPLADEAKEKEHSERL